MTDWTTVDDLVGVLRRRWEAGRYLRDRAQGHPWTPVDLPVRGPSARDLLDRFSEAVAWSRRFERDSGMHTREPRFHVDYRSVGGRHVGTNALPARVRLETFEQLCAVLGTAGQVRALDDLMAVTDATFSDLVPWVAAHPLRALEHRDVWPEVLAVVAWISSHDPGRLYLRQLDVEGVDTKFVDRHRRLLDDLLVTVLPADRIDLRFTASDFARRFGFRQKPGYTRLRLLEHEPAVPAGVSELTLRTEELATVDLVARTIFVVENEISYLAFPPVPGALVVFGSGFALGGLSEVPWLGSREIVYWGDLDTHGFDILHRLRGMFPSVRSMLMDEATLLAHRRQWVREPSPTARSLPDLSPAEQDLYQALVEDRFGPAVRLEQERVRFSFVRQAAMSSGTSGGPLVSAGSIPDGREAGGSACPDVSA